MRTHPDRGAETPVFRFKYPRFCPQVMNISIHLLEGKGLIAKKVQIARRKLKHLCKTAPVSPRNCPATEFARCPHRDWVDRGAETPRTRLRGVGRWGGEKGA